MGILTTNYGIDYSCRRLGGGSTLLLASSASLKAYPKAKHVKAGGTETKAGKTEASQM
jgi:hypothetical protein